MWVIRNKKYGNYYKSEIPNILKHFVLDIDEATMMKKNVAEEKMKIFNHQDNYELVYVRKKRKKYR